MIPENSYEDKKDGGLAINQSELQDSEIGSQSKNEEEKVGARPQCIDDGLFNDLGADV